MTDKLVINFNEYTKTVEKLAIQIHNKCKPTVLVGIGYYERSSSYIGHSFKNFKITYSLHSNS